VAWQRAALLQQEGWLRRVFGTRAHLLVAALVDEADE
jgi:hypothetical protein